MVKSSSSAKPPRLPKVAKKTAKRLPVVTSMRELAKRLPPEHRPLVDPAGQLFHATEDTILLVLPECHAGLNAHNKGHWSKKQILVKALRWKAKTRAQSCQVKAWEAATIEYRFFFPDAIRRDQANAIQSQKPAIDGIVDSGLLRYDDWQHLHITGVFCAIDASNPRTELLLRRATTADLAARTMSQPEFKSA